ncbi:diacylglycerol kinase family protein [Gemmatimonas sp.]|uniref:diacylglycerol/lipid kinase family protein n=1 Tax=Gemmatimonas sp. TaxID=1962908 RepID=UPI00333FD024
MIGVLVNPAAGGGRAKARAVLVARALAESGDVRLFETRARGDERALAIEACDAGARIVAVVGGDGSSHHAARGLLESGAPIPLAIFAAGTGNDFVKTLGTPSHDVPAMAARVMRGTSLAIDVGVIDGVPFLNAAGMGFDVAVLERMQQPSTSSAFRLRGTAAYVSTALGALLRYDGFDAQLHHGTDHVRASSPNTRHLMTVFANGRAFGGAFRIAPTASLTDGQLDVVDFARLSPVARLATFFRATRGTHLSHAAVHHARATHIVMTSRVPLAFEADGERYRAAGTTIDVTVRPQALRVIV